MAVSQELVAKFKADTADFNNKVKKVKNDIDSVGSKAKEMSNDIENGANKSSVSMSNLANRASMAATAIGTATVAVGVFSVKVGADMESAANRTEAMLGSVEKANYVISELRQTGYETGASILGLSDSYGKLATFVENGSVTLQESIDLQTGLTNTSIALGASNEQLSTVMYGLSQALGSGVVRAEEFNQVTEPLPGIINRMEEATGLASGELRKMVNDGLITSEMFKNILIPALASFQGQASDMSDTLKVQAGIMSNTFIALGEDIYDYLNKPMAGFIGLIDDAMQSMVSLERKSNSGLKNELKSIEEQRKALTMKMSVQKAITGGLADNSIKDDLNELFLNEAKIQSMLRGDNPLFKKDTAKRRDIEIDEDLQNEIKQLRARLNNKSSRPTNRGLGRSTSQNKSLSGSSISNRHTNKIQESEDELFPIEIKSYAQQMSESLGNFSMDVKEETSLIKEVFGDMQDSIVSGFITMSSNGSASFKEMTASILSDIQSIIVRTLAMQAITGIINSVGSAFISSGGVQNTSSGVGFGSHGASGFVSVAGARAKGGAVMANKTYLIGEDGPELLEMGSQGGYVHSNKDSFGNSNNTMIVNIDARGASHGVESDIRRVMNEVNNLRKQVPSIAKSAVRNENSRNLGYLA